MRGTGFSMGAYPLAADRTGSVCRVRKKPSRKAPATRRATAAIPPARLMRPPLSIDPVRRRPAHLPAPPGGALDGRSESVVPAGTSVTEHDAAIVRSPYLEGTGEERAWSQATRHGRHPTVPRFPVNFRSIIWFAPSVAPATIWPDAAGSGAE